MLKYILSFFIPKCYDLFLRYDPIPNKNIVVDILSSALQIDQQMSEALYNASAKSGQWCIASSVNKKEIETLQFSLNQKGLKTYVEVN